MQQAVHQVVADEGTGGVGYAGGDAAGLADAEDRVGLFPFDGGVDNVDGFAEYGRDFQLDDFDITDPAGKELDGF